MPITHTERVLEAPAFEIQIPFPIFPKARPRFSTTTNTKKQIQTYMPAAYLKCVADIGMLLRAKMPKNWNLFASYKLTGAFYLDDSTQGDADQLIGTIMDAGNQLVWHDDRQIAELVVIKFIIGALGRRAIVGVHELPLATGFEPSDATVKTAIKNGEPGAAKELKRRDEMAARCAAKPPRDTVKIAK